jgi:DNA sulfur modification protein DndB
VIDGQHRLYGYAKSDRRYTTKIPVVAFVGLKKSEQAKLFVEINEKQTPVERNLLWDLYSDIYEGSEDPEQIEDLTISNVVKLLNAEEGALQEHIYLPGVKRDSRTNITMTNICSAIKKNAVLSQDYFGSARFENQKDKEQQIAGKIGTFFDVVEELLPDDWNRGEKGFTRSNNGIAALLIVLKQILKYLKQLDQEHVYKKRKVKDFHDYLTQLLEPTADFLKSDPELPGQLRKQRGVAGQTEAAFKLCQSIQEVFPDFKTPPGYFAPLPKDVRKADGENVKDQIEKMELFLRGFVVKNLKDLYGEAEWYDKGIPGDPENKGTLKGSIEKMVRDEIIEHPWLEKEFASSPEKKIQFTHLGNLKDIITYSDNWRRFRITFKTQQNLDSRFKHLIALRNATQHFRDADQEVYALGSLAMRWLRNSIGEWIEHSE